MNSDVDNPEGLTKNLKKMEEAEIRLKQNPRYQEALERYEHSKFWSLGKDNWGHCLLNIWTETARAEPYLFVHEALYYFAIPSVLLNIGLIAALLLT